ncbi:3-oxoacyl-ACP reductase FabG [Nocardia puris]|uniref:3-oxoacyl-ACP reductase family protein n=1 Tax=Nocardia puris TaxID=208602 RepID=UPI00189611FE|nr:3-oxoacyl-ACP reductase family protein [Nocardia puris]MBF6212736.1 3-oxoacyl-ACP reductase FabG [Nocardia puris]MBF6367673.1 3-oxoacyl-ACP reductase FabG [Nocardia puris]MBF6461324.1 3-oxoacyl-ACP reductase FabG [Nocardia puris]
MTDLAGKVALVTGGSRGIGAAIARRLAADGATVALTYRNGGALAEEVVSGIEAGGGHALAIRADSGDAAEVAAAVHYAADELGRFDILVNNAGIFAAKPFEEFSVEEVDRALHVHARAAFVGAQAAVGRMNGGGRIISIGSNLTERAPFAGLTLYNLSKSALNGFTKALARELGPRDITVNLVQPGSTDTDMNPADAEDAADQVALSALGRFGAAEDIAGTVAFLAGPSGRNITGAILTVDGGTNA